MARFDWSKSKYNDMTLLYAVFFSIDATFEILAVSISRAFDEKDLQYFARCTGFTLVVDC